MRGSVWVDCTSLAARGNHMDKEETIKPKPKPNPEATLEVASPSNPSGSAPSGQIPQSKMGASGTQEVLLHSYVEANTEKASTDHDMDDLSSITPSQLEEEDELLRSPEKQEPSQILEDAIQQLSSLWVVKRSNLTNAQRRAAIQAKLLERGEAFDPAKFRKGKKKKPKRPERGETLNLETASRGASYRDTSATKMAIVLEGYPEAKLSAEQGEVIQEAIIDELLLPLEDGCTPSFAGTYMEKGALIISCINDATKHWLETLIPRLKPLGDTKLIVGLRKEILRSVRVFFRAHPLLLKKTPEKIIEMLDKQNPTLKVKEWNVLPAKPDPKGYGFVCFLDEACFSAVRSVNSRANLGLWQVSIISTPVKDNAKGPSNQSPPQ